MSADASASQALTPLFLLELESTKIAAGANILTIISTMGRRKPHSHGVCLPIQPVSFQSLLTPLPIVHPSSINDS